MTTQVNQWPVKGGDFTENMFSQVVKHHPDWKNQGEKRFALGLQPPGFFDTAREVLLFDGHEVVTLIVMPLKWNNWIVLQNKQYAGIIQVLSNLLPPSSHEVAIRICDILWQEFLRQASPAIRCNGGVVHAFLVYLVMHGFPEIKSLPRWINVGRWYNWWLDHAITKSPQSLSSSSSASSSSSSSSPVEVTEAKTTPPEESKTDVMDFLLETDAGVSSELLPTSLPSH